MTKRISLVEGLKRDKEVHENLDPAAVESFLKHGKVSAKPADSEDAGPLQLVAQAVEDKRPRVAQPQGEKRRCDGTRTDSRKRPRPARLGYCAANSIA